VNYMFIFTLHVWESECVYNSTSDRGRWLLNVSCFYFLFFNFTLTRSVYQYQTQSVGWCGVVIMFFFPFFFLSENVVDNEVEF
jgi:hypothetical protein